MAADSITRIWLIRHAPVDGPRGVIHAADAPAELSNTMGFAALRAALPAAAPAFCSPARRTRDTARTLGLDPAIVEALREQDFGLWTGQRHDDLAATQGEAYGAFWRAPALNAPPGGESFVDQVTRVAAAIASLPSGDVIVVAHSGTVRAALAIALDASADSALRFVIDPLSLTRIDRLAAGWRIGAVNRGGLTARHDVSTLAGDADA
jgi:alpha-ribazole phosphatase